MSIPALLISLNALAVSQQQRADALAQRAEDQKERAAAKAQAEFDAKAGYARRVTAWAGEKLLEATVRNANSDWVWVSVVATSIVMSESSAPPDVETYGLNVPPCTEVTVLPRIQGAEDEERIYDLEFVLAHPADERRPVWMIGAFADLNAPAEASLVEKTKHAFPMTEPLDTVKRAIRPCT
ncbi:hypothetical protein [Nonomuraea typhae]|uniref:Uncharacterized protein n=1 Tax=Nonomuraea typhae TaxID=2603600 RepID=A0ABW7ZES7_9ACTN